MEKILERNIKRNFLGKPHKEEYIDIIDKKLELLSGEISFKIEEIALID
jgi:disulfide oxidoreductase YuzD